MSDEKLDVLLVGIGGYGENYLDEFLNSNRDDFRIVGVVDPFAEKSPRIEEIKKMQIPVFSKMGDFYEDNSADYVCISSPIHYHSEQTIMALKNGAGVLCEKPLSATVQEGYRMLEVEKEAEKPVGIGYQWSFSSAIQNLKRDIIKGVFGKPLRFKTLVVWPRDFKYYNRNSWAGKKKDSNGKWILDSVANNATAHYLHNMLYVLGDSIEKSAWPERLETELYRANDIENFDTTAARLWTDNGVELFYLVTHATKDQLNPRFCYEFENATVYFDQDQDCQIVAEFKGGKRKVYGDPFADSFKKIWIMLDAVKGKGSYLCGIEAALPHVVCINGMQESVEEIIDFPEELIMKKQDKSGKDSAIYVDGLTELMLTCYNNWKLPTEEKVDWAVKGQMKDLERYKYFPSS